MDLTEELLVDLMGDLDVELLEGDYMETDLTRSRAAWLATFIKEKNWRKDDADEIARTAGAEKEKKRLRRKKTEKIPLSYEWGEAIRTDMGKRFQNGVRSVKRRASTLWGFVSGVLTMAVIAISFFAVLDKKKRAV